MGKLSNTILRILSLKGHNGSPPKSDRKLLPPYPPIVFAKNMQFNVLNQRGGQKYSGTPDPSISFVFPYVWKQIGEWEGNELNPFLKVVNRAGMKNSIPKIQERESEAFILGNLNFRSPLSSGLWYPVFLIEWVFCWIE